MGLKAHVSLRQQTMGGVVSPKGSTVVDTTAKLQLITGNAHEIGTRDEDLSLCPSW